jgi:RNA polymerase sigma-70 factor (ECF subfamily)
MSRLESKTDAELVAEALGGAEEAFREIVVRFERPIYSLIVRMVQDPAMAEDLAQEVFVKAFRRLDTYDPVRKLSSWLFKVAHNTTIDHLRRHAPETVPLEGGKKKDDDDHRGGLAAVLADETTEDPAAAAERKDMARSLERAISRLRPDYREVVVLFYIEGASYQEICDALDLPLGTVKTNLHRARKELAEEMKTLGWGRETLSAPGS